MVFVVSPDSARSDVCRWEIDETARLSKRILPVLWRPPGAISVPEKLAALNYVRFDEGRSFMSGIRALRNALNTDLDWLREHTRLLARALEWDTGGRAANRLLSGADIRGAKDWIARRPRNAPEPTPLHLDFVKASESWETAQQGERQRQLEERERLVRQAETDRRALTVTPGGQSHGRLKPLRIQRSTNRAREKTGAILLTTDRVGKLGIRIRKKYEAPADPRRSDVLLWRLINFS